MADLIIFLYGPDGYRLKENVDIIVGAYRKKYESGMSYHRFDFTSPTCKGVDEVSNAIKSVSFFDEAKLIVVKNALSYSGQTTINNLEELLRKFKISEDKKTVLVFVENKSESDLRKVNKDLFALLSSKNNLVRNIEYLNGVKLSNWVRGKFKENGQGISPPVAGLLTGIVGNESWALANEISKLSNYSTASRRFRMASHEYSDATITEKDINLLVGRKEDNNIFDLIDAVGNQNKAKAFEMMYRLINAGHDGYYLLSMLVYHFENLLSVSDLLTQDPMFRSRTPKHYEIVAKQCGLHPFVAKKAVSQAQKFQKGDLVAKFNHLAGLDVSSKSGLTNLEDSLYNFVLA